MQRRKDVMSPADTDQVFDVEKTNRSVAANYDKDAIALAPVQQGGGLQFRHFLRESVILASRRIWSSSSPRASYHHHHIARHYELICGAMSAVGDRGICRRLTASVPIIGTRNREVEPVQLIAGRVRQSIRVRRVKRWVWLLSRIPRPCNRNVRPSNEIRIEPFGDVRRAQDHFPPSRLRGEHGARNEQGIARCSITSAQSNDIEQAEWLAVISSVSTSATSTSSHHSRAHAAAVASVLDADHPVASADALLGQVPR